MKCRVILLSLCLAGALSMPAAALALTAAEAAVIIDRLLAMGDVATADTFSQDLVPVWAYQAVVNMDAVSVVSMTGELNASLTRGEAAEMLSAMLDVLDSRNTGWFK